MWPHLRQEWFVRSVGAVSERLLRATFSVLVGTHEITRPPAASGVSVLQATARSDER